MILNLSVFLFLSTTIHGYCTRTDLNYNTLRAYCVDELTNTPFEYVDSYGSILETVLRMSDRSLDELTSNPIDEQLNKLVYDVYESGVHREL